MTEGRMTDASDAGYGALACDCSAEEARAAAAKGTDGLWGPRAEQHADLEREVEAAEEQDDLPAGP